jgi:hypothetical protein
MSTSTYRILYWHDIPIQVRAEDEDGRVSAPLPDRFQVAIDNAAMAAGRTDADVYTETFRWGELQQRPGTAQEVGDAVVAELDAQYPTIEWPKTAETLRQEK